MNRVGNVILVGAGSGDAGLLTLRGKQVLEAADVVLYDRLVSGEVLSLIPDFVVKIDVGKESGCHSIPQNEINGLVLRYAKDGKRVVRLKGGDPFMFGRGAEELEAVIKENIPFEVVPGVTSATAVPAYAGIPVSHREFASSVHIVTAHRKNGEVPRIDYESLVKLGGTLIFLMGLGSIEALTAGLLNAGIDANTPAALIENGTHPNQRKLVSTVTDIATKSRDYGFCPPSILVVGAVCSLSDKLDWFSRLPLKGVNVVVTRPKTGNGLSRGLRELGANVIDFPCIRTEALPLPDFVFNRLSSYGWIVFTSPVGAKIFFNALNSRDIDIRSLYKLKFAAIGAKTAAAIACRGIYADYVPLIYNSKEMAKGLPLGEDVGNSVLLFNAEDGAPELAPALGDRGFSVEVVAAYKTIRECACAEDIRVKLTHGEVDFIAFTSASTVRGFTGSLPELDYSKLTAVCIGEETASAANEHGFLVLISKQATTESMIELIKEETCK